MSINFAVLLDGGFVRHKLSTARTRVDAPRIHSFATQVLALPCLAGMRLLRVAGWRLKSRVLLQPGPRIEIGAEDLEPSILQKGVDMRIGLDIASLTLKHQAQVIVLVTGDSDFIPAMKFARREGAQLVLITMGHGIRDAMREHADLVIDDFPLPVLDRSENHSAGPLDAQPSPCRQSISTSSSERHTSA